MPNKSAKRANPPKQPTPRLVPPQLAALTPQQRKLHDAMAQSRGKSGIGGGPFGVWLRAPAFGDHAQALGAHCRYHTAVPPRLSEFAILVIARHWRAQFEWTTHARIASNEGVSEKTIAALRAGKRPSSARKDELAIYDFLIELHKTRRVGARNYKRLHTLLGEQGMIEFVGIAGYYTLVAMTLNVFAIPVGENDSPPFREPAQAT